MQKKYLIIYDELVKGIQAGEWPAGTMLPSENELSLHYETSRETIRKALNLLSQKGYIQKIRGKGSVVIDFHTFSFPVSGIESYTELTKKLQLESRTIIHQLGFLEANHDISEMLHQSVSDRVWNVVRIREISGERIILDKDYFNERYVPLLSKEICRNSIYDYIENQLGLVIGFAQKEILVESPTDEDRELLDIEGFSNVVVIRSQVYLDDASLFQYTESRHRPDKFRFVDFARRVKN
ncbi:trehalose operon repressor [Oceanobacillus massiliensis]|uniref:trehalose operon repressor n=1 Tax=Oceanobacillus massiliensis TaxID=1465765 RepID=UPI003019E0EE